MSEQPQLTPEEIEARRQQKQVELEVFNKKKQRVSDLLNSYKSQIAQALPKILTPDRMIRTALTAMLRKPELMDCTGHSLISCILTAAQLGLMPDDILGEAYLIPFFNGRKQVLECQLIPGYKGLCTLAMRSGQVKSITAVAVYNAKRLIDPKREGDHFDYELGLNEKLEHKPVGLTDSNLITHFWGLVRLVSGGVTFRVMTRAQVEAVRDESKNYIKAKNKADTVWAKSFEEMGCKTVIRRVLKYVPLSPEVARAIGLDEAAEMGSQKISIDFIDETPEFTEDITHEIVKETEQQQQEQENEQREQVLNKADAVVGSTMDAINKAGSKAAQPLKNQRTGPRVQTGTIFKNSENEGK